MMFVFLHQRLINLYLNVCCVVLDQNHHGGQCLLILSSQRDIHIQHHLFWMSNEKVHLFHVHADECDQYLNLLLCKMQDVWCTNHQSIDLNFAPCKTIQFPSVQIRACGKEIALG